MKDVDEVLMCQRNAPGRGDNGDDDDRTMQNI